MMRLILSLGFSAMCCACMMAREAPASLSVVPTERTNPLAQPGVYPLSYVAITPVVVDGHHVALRSDGTRVVQRGGAECTLQLNPDDARTLIDILASTEDVVPAREGQLGDFSVRAHSGDRMVTGVIVMLGDDINGGGAAVKFRQRQYALGSADAFALRKLIAGLSCPVDWHPALITSLDDVMPPRDGETPVSTDAAVSRESE